MSITLIVATDLNGAIGVDNKLPWHIPEDLIHFKNYTQYKPVVMGRTTYESIGKPLVNRFNFVLSRNTLWKGSDNITVLNSKEEVLKKFENLDVEVCIIGGEQIYEMFFDIADKVVLTKIETELENADAYFPIKRMYDSDAWQVEDIKSESNGEYKYHFITYKRKESADVSDADV